MRALKKKPLQIYIEPRQDSLLESLAKHKKTSKAEIIRLSIDRYLGSMPPTEDPALGIIKLGRSGKGNISDTHDSYLAQYIASQGEKRHALRPKRKRA